MTDISAFRDYQACSTVLMERERAVDLRRASLLELRQSVQQLQSENDSREEQLRGERARYNQKKVVQDDKVDAKEAQVRAHQDRLAQLTAEEERLTAALAASGEAVATATAELERRQELEGRLRDVKERLTQLKYQLEDKDAKTMKLETRLARQEMMTEKRHTAVAERVPQHWLPRIVAAEPGTGLEDTAGESVLLVDEGNF